MRACITFLCLAALAAPALGAAPHGGEKAPPGITEHLGAKLPLDLEFVDETGAKKRLGDYFKSGRPIVLDLIFYNCPSLCNIQLNAQLNTMKEVDKALGTDYEVVSVSIDHTETPALAAAKKASYMLQLGSDGVGWHFLTGTEGAIKALAEVVGYEYWYDRDQKMYVHGAAIFFVSPDGTLTRYLHGLSYPPDVFRMALLESGGASGLGERAELWIRQWDPERGKYVPALGRILGASGGLVLLLLLLALGLYRRRAAASS